LSIAEINPSIPFSDGPEGRVSSADPMPAPKLGMWLFLASETMFFIGLLGSFIVLESAGSQHPLFVNSSHMLSKLYGICGVLCLIASSAAISNLPRKLPVFAFLVAIGFILVQCIQWIVLLNHHTVVVVSGGNATVLDGNKSRTATVAIYGKSLGLVNRFDIHGVTEADFSGEESWRQFDQKDVHQDANYGPGRNNFFAMYFLMSTAHVLHLLAGIIAVLWFLIFAKGKLPDAVQIYWHFVNAVGVISFMVLYFV
jgi:heme/copper-type cytochrome/quinol oxidase subunit 3